MKPVRLGVNVAHASVASGFDAPGRHASDRALATVRGFPAAGIRVEWGDGSTSMALVRRFDMEDREIRAALDHHWAASDASDFEVEHQIYREDAVLEYPQSGERIRGRRQIQLSRTAQPNRKRFTVRRIVGAGELWVTEYVLTYDGQPSYTVSIMEFRDGKVARETQYFGDPFEPGPSRAQWVERMS
jgi:ketosteroid isomerase-like protein